MTYSTNNDPVPQLGAWVREMETNHTSGTVKLGKYVDVSIYEDTEKIAAYLNSMHISGPTDSKGRDKPFFNICIPAVNIWYRLTDIDRKNIILKSNKSSKYITSLLANAVWRNEMKKNNFGEFLNEWGMRLAEYGSIVVKIVEKDNTLYPTVIPWNRMICDPIDFENNLKIEKLYLTPAQILANKYYDKTEAYNLVNAVQTRKTMGGQQQDNYSGYIEVYEVHGMMPLSLITNKEKDNETFVQQMHVLSYVLDKNEEYQDYSLVKGREDLDPYTLTYLIKEDGIVLGKGAVKQLFEAQWMVNHTQKSIKDQLDLSSKLVFQTSDPTYAGRNALSNLDTGDILIHKPNEPLTQLNNGGHDVSSLVAIRDSWKTNGGEITSTPDVLRGINMPSGTPLGATQLLNENSSSLFEQMTENKGLQLEYMMRKFFIPNLKKKLDSKEEILAILKENEIQKLDSAFIANKSRNIVNQSNKEKILSGEIVTEPIEEQLKNVESNLKASLQSSGTQRYISPEDVDTKTWKEVFKDFEWEVDIEITNENIDKQALLTSLATISNMVQNPYFTTTNSGKYLLSKAIEASGAMSPLEIPTDEPVTPTQSVPTTPQSMVQT